MLVSSRSIHLVSLLGHNDAVHTALKVRNFFNIEVIRFRNMVDCLIENVFELISVQMKKVHVLRSERVKIFHKTLKPLLKI